MTFQIRAFFEYEGKKLQLDDPDGLYTLAGDFVPPPVSIEPSVAAGSAANIREGGSLATVKAANRAWAFGVNVRGTSEAEITSGIRRLNQFIRQATHERPVYFHYRGSNDVPFNPRFGTYGADLRYEVVFGRATTTLAYPTGVASQQILPEARIELQVKPYAIGLPQLMAYTEGGILEDVIGIVDGVSRGTIVPPATTNKFTNPIFGDATIAWNNAWTNGTNIVEVENKDTRFITHGKSSAKLLSIGSTLNTFTQSLNVGNTNTHILSCYVKKQDGSAVTSADVELTYGGAVTENYDLVGDGWYRVWGLVTGVASGTTTGVIVKQGRTIYCDGFQIEERDELITPLAHGDMLGVAWSGSVHQSTSVRAGTRLQTQSDQLSRHPLESAEGTIRCVWKADHPNTEYPNAPVNRFLFLTDTSDHYSCFVPEFDTFQFSDGTNVIISSAQSWSKGDIIVFHWTWGSFGLKMYFNGSEIATGSSYTPFDSTITPEIKIGSSGSAAAHILGTFMDFSTFDEAMTATEVLADRTNILEQVEDNRRLAPIPWFWTSGGDGRVENCNDGTKLNYGVAGGIPGSAPALTRLRMEMDTTWGTAQDIWLSLFSIPVKNFIDPDGHIWNDHSGSAEASACGGAVEVYNIDGSSSESDGILNVNNYEIIAGKDLYILIRLKDAGTNLLAQMQLDVGESINTDYKALAADATQRLFLLGPLPALSYRAVGRAFAESNMDNQADIRFKITRVTGTAANNVSLDFIMVVARPFVNIKADFLTTTRYTVLEGGSASQWASSTDAFLAFVPTLGDRIEFEPDQLNILQSMIGRDSIAHEVDDEDFDYLDILVTPRWELV